MNQIIIANLISVLPFLLIISIFLYYPFQLMKLVIPVFKLKFIVGYFASIIVPEFIKPKVVNLSPIMQRPEGACGCDYFSEKGDVSGNPGFPSGHMSSVAFFTTYNLIYLLNAKINKTTKYSLIFLYLFNFMKYKSN